MTINSLFKNRPSRILLSFYMVSLPVSMSNLQFIPHSMDASSHQLTTAKPLGDIFEPPPRPPDLSGKCHATPERRTDAHFFFFVLCGHVAAAAVDAALSLSNLGLTPLTGSPAYQERGGGMESKR